MVMETTYSHLSDADHIQRAEEAFGIREPEDDSPLTPNACNVCGSPLEPDAKACSRCGNVYTPDAQQAKKEIDEALWQDMREAESEEDKDALEQLKSLIESNPELLDELTESTS